MSTLRERVTRLAQEQRLEGAPVRKVDGFDRALIRDQKLATLIVKHSPLHSATVQGLH